MIIRIVLRIFETNSFDFQFLEKKNKTLNTVIPQTALLANFPPGEFISSNEIQRFKLKCRKTNRKISYVFQAFEQKVINCYKIFSTPDLPLLNNYIS